MHDASSFLTLTYSDEHLPENYSVSVRTLQLFFKRLRKALSGKIRYFACGEYGGQRLRPHYHAIIFGFEFPDKQLWRKTSAGYLTYRSALLDKTWGLGHAEIGTVTVESAGYVARYVTKKLSGDGAVNYYERMHPGTGEIWKVAPEFAVMSSKPGIGRSWYDQYSGDAFPSDFVTVNGDKRSVPRYYKKLLAASDDRFNSPSERITWERKSRALLRADNNTPERLAVREELQEIKAKSLKRSLEDEL